jgi:hypothetical protein
MRYVIPLSALPVLVGACSSAPAGDGASQSSASAYSAQGDQADTSCNVALRHTYINFESRLGPQTDCSSGTCWVVITVTFDVAMAPSFAQAQGFVLYQGEGSSTWQQSPQAEPVFGAPVGFRRYQVTLHSGTFTNGPGDTTVRLIPFLRLASGARIFDHNRVADPVGNYALTPLNNWTISDDASTCPGTAPTATLTATFATGWQNSSSGSLAGGGKLDVAYDIYRMPQTLSCTTDGVAAFATLGFVQFQPSGQVLSEVVSGPFDAAAGKYQSIPMELDVPQGTTSAALWFYSSSDCTGPFWDSDYGRNYVFTAP